MNLFRTIHNGIDLILNMEVGLDPRIGDSIAAQIKALAAVEAFLVRGEWFLPKLRGILLEDVENAVDIGTAFSSSPEYAAVLDAAPPIEDAQAIMLLDPTEAAGLLREAWGTLESPFLGLRDKIGSALEEWGLLPAS